MSAIREEPITGRCSRCHENTVFEESPYQDGTLYSVCCSWPPLDPSDIVDRNDD